MGVELEDSGSWSCFIKDDVQSHHSVQDTIQVEVAQPYLLSVTPYNPVKVLSEQASNMTDDEVICAAAGGGDREPVMEWYINGNRVESQYTRTWKVIKFYGKKLM